LREEYKEKPVLLAEVADLAKGMESKKVEKKNN
jgi:hypothetical protein